MTQGGTGLRRWEGRSLQRWRAELHVPKFVALAETTSTNDLARELADGGAPHGTIVLSEYQSVGRGRRGRRWVAPPGSSLLMSMVLRPADSDQARSGPPGIAPVLPLRVGLATVVACEHVAGRELAIKWPNDLMAEDAKLGGILCESALGGPGGGYAVAGIGVNVLQHEGAGPAEIGQPAVSLAEIGRRAFSRAELLGALVPRLTGIRCDEAWEAREYQELARRDWLRGRLVRLEDGTLGRGEGIRHDGGLAVRIGKSTRVITGGTVRSAPEDA